jgi:putative tricarboxylic transport membrane protein
MNAKSLASGGVCIAVGAFFAISALTSLKVGSSTNMGPGYFPLALAIILILTGLYIAGQGAVTERGEMGRILSDIPWRAMLLLSFAPIFLGFTIEGLGLPLAVFITGLLSAFASRTQTVRLATFVSALLAAFCTLVFGYILKLPIPLIGSWLSF